MVSSALLFRGFLSFIFKFYFSIIKKKTILQLIAFIQLFCLNKIDKNINKQLYNSF